MSLAALLGPPRVVGVDVARAVAIVGMIAAHTGVQEGLRWTDPGTWGALAHGRSAVLFAVVAGISVALLTRDLTGPDVDADAVRTARLRILGRAGAVGAIGIVLELASTAIAVVLVVYALAFVLVIPFLRWSRPRLLVAAFLVAAVSATAIPALRVSFGVGMGSGVQFAFDNVYRPLGWLALMLVGLAVGRSDLRSARVAAVLVAGGTASAFAGGILGATTRDLPFTIVSSAGSAAVAGLSAVEHSGGLGEFLQSGGLGVAVVGLLLLVTRTRVARLVALPVAALGSMPLTVYTVHVVTFEVALRRGSPEIGFSFWLVSVVAFAVLTTTWALTLGRGPLERLVARAADRTAHPRVAPNGVPTSDASARMPA